MAKTLSIIICILLTGTVLAINDSVSYQEVLSSPGKDWLTYGGDYFSQRYSPLNTINSNNVSGLKLKWQFKIPAVQNMRATPLVYRDTMYVSGDSGVYAINAVTGRKLWEWSVSPTKKHSGVNRGVALMQNKVFHITSDCRLTALNMDTGALLWQHKYIQSGKGYYCSLAPLALKDKVIAGVSFDEKKNKGFVAAFGISDGKELWRFSTVAEDGHSGSETWTIPDSERNGAATWLNGSYDPGLNIVYWTTGTALPYEFSRERDRNLSSDNLYSNSLLALNPDTGKLLWHFQFTPADPKDWDSNQIPVLADTIWNKKPRKLVLQANRNGFFYVLDRKTGEFLLGSPFVKKLSWATLNKNGRPISTVKAGSRICPALFGATNWMPPSYSPKTGLFYVVSFEHCDGEPAINQVEAINPFTGQIIWNYTLEGGEYITAGLTSTAGEIIFTGNKKKEFIALHAVTGKLLWRYPLEYSIFSAPIVYSKGHNEYVSIAAGQVIYTFGF